MADETPVTPTTAPAPTSIPIDTEPQLPQVPIDLNPEYDPAKDQRAPFLKVNPNPTGPTIEPAPQPGLLERAKKVVTEGIPRYSTRTPANPKYGQEQFLAPEEALTPEEQRQHPVATGALEAAGGLTSPATVATVGATAGLGEAGIIPKVLSGLFAGQIAASVYDQYPALKDAVNRAQTAKTQQEHDDAFSDAQRILTHMGVDTVAGLLAAKHGAEGAKEILDKTTGSGVPDQASTFKNPNPEPVAGPEETHPEMNRQTVKKLQDLGYSNQHITNFNIGEIRDILKNQTPAAEYKPAGVPEAPKPAPEPDKFAAQGGKLVGPQPTEAVEKPVEAGEKPSETTDPVEDLIMSDKIGGKKVKGATPKVEPTVLAQRAAVPPAKLPPQPKLPDTGTYPAIQTDDGSIYFDRDFAGKTHIMFAKEQGIPPERIVSGGWIKDGDYEGTERSDAGRWGEQARASLRSTAARGLVERSTGDEKADAAIKSAGAIPAGTSLGMALFHDPKTGSTLAFKPGTKITPEAVQAHLAASRQAFGIKPEPEAFAAQGGKMVGQQPTAEPVHPAIAKLAASENENARPIQYSYSAPFSNKTTPSMIFPDGRITNAMLEHADVAKEAGFIPGEGETQESAVHKMLDSTGAIRVQYPTRGGGGMGVQLNHPPTPEQTQVLAHSMKKAEAAGYGDGKLVWDFMTSEGTPTSGYGTVGDFQRAADAWRDKNPEQDIVSKELQNPHKETYGMEVIDREGKTQIVPIEAHSPKQALALTQKKFPEAGYWGIQTMPEVKAPSTEYSVPTAKIQKMKASAGRPEVHTIRHELGHALVGLADGLDLKGMISSSHPAGSSDMRAGVLWTGASLYERSQDGSLQIRAAKRPAVLKQMMAGIAADEVFNDVPRAANHNFPIEAGGDGTQAYEILRAAGFNHAEALEEMHNLIDSAKDYLTHPEVAGIIRENENFREAGLSRQFHYSPERLQSMNTEVQRRIADAEQKLAGAGSSNNQTTGTVAAENRPTDVAGGKGEVSPADKGFAPEGEEGIVSEEKVSPKNQDWVDAAKWEESPNTGYRHLVLRDESGKQVGRIAHDNYRVRLSELDDQYTNKGIGKALYERAFADAKQNGVKELMSDTSLSPDAARVWDSLAKSGKYNITAEPSKEVNRGKVGNAYDNLHTQYTVHFDQPKDIVSEEKALPHAKFQLHVKYAPESPEWTNAGQYLTKEGAFEAERIFHSANPKADSRISPIESKDVLSEEKVKEPPTEVSWKHPEREPNTTDYIATHAGLGQVARIRFRPEPRSELLANILPGTGQIEIRDVHSKFPNALKNTMDEAIKDAKQQGFRNIVSNSDMSPANEKVWDSLKDRYAVKKIKTKTALFGESANQYIISLHDDPKIGNQLIDEAAKAVKNYKPVPVEKIIENLQNDVQNQSEDKDIVSEEKVKKTPGVTPELAQKIVDAHATNGGSTFNLTHGDLAGTDNYAVSTNPERGQTLDHPPTAKDIQGFAKKNNDLLQNPEKSLGTWHNTADNTHALDVVSTIKNRAKAIALGKKHNQIAIFHLGTFTEIPTGGTGSVPLNPEQKAQARAEKRIADWKQGPAFVPSTGGTAKAPAAPPPPVGHEDVPTISTRTPRIIVNKTLVDDHSNRGLTSDMQAAAAAPGFLKKLADRVSNTPGFKDPGGDDHEARVNAYIRHVADNTKFVQSKVTPEEHATDSQWYPVGAHERGIAVAKAHDLSPHQAYAATAALSPLTDWDQNTAQAERAAEIWKNQQNTKFTPQMRKAADEILTVPEMQHFKKEFKSLEGKTLGELKNVDDQAWWLRLYEEGHYDRSFQTWNPDGTSGGLAMNSDGVTPKAMSWSFQSLIENAIDIMKDGSHENISRVLGDGHKVRNFYNNQLSPDDPRFLTIDTHQVNIGQLRPMSGSHPSVSDNFETPQNAPFGLSGTYVLHDAGTRLAAKELGIDIPSRLQSSGWVKIRKQFPNKFKTEENLAVVDAIWKEHTDGKITADAARNKIWDFAERWNSSNTGKTGNPGDQTELFDAGVRGETPSGTAGRGDRNNAPSESAKTSVDEGDTDFNFGANEKPVEATSRQRKPSAKQIKNAGEWTSLIKSLSGLNKPGTKK